MKRITVYADFDFLATPQEIGTLGYEHVRGKDSNHQDFQRP
jgi:serine/threonine-protein kinase HipA